MRMDTKHSQSLHLLLLPFRDPSPPPPPTTTTHINSIEARDGMDWRPLKQASSVRLRPRQPPTHNPPNLRQCKGASFSRVCCRIPCTITSASQASTKCVLCVCTPSWISWTQNCPSISNLSDTLPRSFCGGRVASVHEQPLGSSSLLSRRSSAQGGIKNAAQSLLPQGPQSAEVQGENIVARYKPSFLFEKEFISETKLKKT